MKGRKKVVAIVGPTASGKSALAVALAKKFNGVVISADSRQVYKGLDVGTEKISKSDRKRVKHFMLDVVSPDQNFNVAEYQKAVYKILDGIAKDNQAAKKPILPIIVGGTALYVDAVCEGFIFPQTMTDSNLRADLEKQPLANLVSRLQELSPTTTVDLKNKRRAVRALEIALSGARPASRKPRYDVLKLGIGLSREKMDQRIEERLERLDLKKLALETKGLERLGLDFNSSPLTALYYRPTRDWLAGLISKEELLTTIGRANKAYARRQMTWWKKDSKIKWISTEEAAFSDIKAFLDED